MSSEEFADIVVVGSCMIDLVSYVSRLPVAGETVQGLKFTQGFGGKGANQCVAATKLGAKTALIARLGEDNFGKTYLDEFKKYPTLNTSHVALVPDQTSGMAPISVANDGENQIVIVPGANLKLSPSDIDDAEPLLVHSKVVLFQGEIDWNTTLYCLRKVKTYSNEAFSTLDPAIFSLADVICVNEVEAEILTNKKISADEDAIECVKTLLDKECNTVIITMGGSGVVYASKQDNATIHSLQVERVTPVDSTGAGDCFLGALSYYYSYFPNLPLREMISRSCQIARLSVLQRGTQESFPSRQALDPNLFA